MRRLFYFCVFVLGPHFALLRVMQCSSYSVIILNGVWEGPSGVVPWGLNPSQLSHDSFYVKLSPYALYYLSGPRVLAFA